MTRTVVHFIESSAFGGTELALLHMLGGLDRRYWRPVLFYHPQPELAPLLEGAQNVDVKLQPVPRMQGKQVLTGVPHFFHMLRAEQPDVFHAHLHWPLACKYGLVMAALARVPAIVATVQLFLELPNPRSIYLQHRIVATGVHRFIAVSHEVAKQLQQTFRLPTQKIRVVHNAISLLPYKRPRQQVMRAGLRRVPGWPVVLTSARLHEQKGHAYLLEAAALLPGVKFVLAGHGPERERLEAQARKLGIASRVAFLGYRSDIPDLLTRCDLFVLPSLYEGLPLSILEAMAAGKPVISTAVGGNGEAVIHGKTGLLVPPADPVALAGAIRSVLSNPELAERLATAGKARVHEKFSADTMVRCITQIYEELLALPEVSHGRG